MTSQLRPRIRLMEAKDLDRVMEVATSLKNAPKWTREAYLAAMAPVASPRRIALVAEVSEEIGGFAVAILTPPEAELEAIVTAAPFQRQGVARALFAFLGNDLRKEGVKVVLLEVRASNEPALTLYRTLGFEESGRRVRYYADPVEDAVLMRLRLL